MSVGTVQEFGKNMTEKLTNQTIRHIFKDIKEEIKKMDDSHGEKFKEIMDCVKLTNGRVKDLEMWRNRVVGALAVITMLLVPVLLQYVSKVTLAFFK